MDIVARFFELAEDWRYYLHRDGLVRALPLVGREVARLPFRHLNYVLVTRSLSEPLPDLQPTIALEIRRFEQADLIAARTMDRPSEARLCARRLAEGHLGLLALHEGRPVGYAWGCGDMDRELERVPLELEPGDVLCTDVFTVPKYRGRGVQTALTLARLQKFRELGYRRAICYIEAGNAPSLAVWQRKLGCASAGRIDFLRVGSWYRVRLNEAVEQTDVNQIQLRKPS
jgi:GNAT superfamily N-acetyltransferase